MFDFLKRKGPDYISSIDGLVDVDARRLAQQHALSVSEIYPLCTRLNTEVSAGGKQIHIHHGVDAAVVDRYIRMAAAAAVVSYELSSRESVQFPKPARAEVADVPRALLKKLGNVQWRATRMGAPTNYHLMGNLYELATARLTLDTTRVDIDIEDLNREHLRRRRV